jgi:TolB protein
MGAVLLLASLAAAAAFELAIGGLWAADAGDALVREGERHLKNVRQLTFGGENAEAYFSADGKKLIFQSTRDGYPADQIYTMHADGSHVRRVSTGKGRCTCSYFFPDGKRILFSSTHHLDPKPPPRPDYSRGYVWPLYPTYDIFTARPDGSRLHQLTHNPGYDAEATISPDGKRIVFTSMRNGDVDLYVMNADGTGVRRLTTALGYDGGAFFSPDGKQIVFRAYRPKTEKDVEDYRALLKENLIRPTTLELYVMNADGTGERQVTQNGAANFCPFFTPDGRRILFASNLGDPNSRNFDLYLIDTDGSHLERVTTDPTFDGFPMFSPDGKRLVWASNRHGAAAGETDIFIADWVP